MNKDNSDKVNHPIHYETGNFECIDVMLETQGEESVKDFCICNAFKYLYRQRNKNGLEDIKKAIWYLNKYVDIVESPHFSTGDDIPGQMEFHIDGSNIWWLDKDLNKMINCDCAQEDPISSGICGEYGGMTYL